MTHEYAWPYGPFLKRDGNNGHPLVRGQVALSGFEWVPSGQNTRLWQFRSRLVLGSCHVMLR